MRYRLLLVMISALVLSLGGSSYGEMLGNPGTQVGEKNLFVGLEYSSRMHTYDLDTRDLDTNMEKVMLKVTTGLTDWLDIYVRGGAAKLTLEYDSNNYVHKTSSGSTNWGNATKNFEADFKPGFGAGTRIRLMNFENSATRVFFDGGGFIFKADDSIRWDLSDGSVITKNRDITWGDIYAGLGVSKRMDYVDLTFGVGFSEIWWEISDDNVEEVGTATTRTAIPDRDSFERTSPVFGFIGLDFVLPLEYRLSLQAGLRSTDDAEFSIAISQGLERDRY